MTIEQVFRENKSGGGGFAFRHPKIARATRFDRLLLILVLA